MQLLTIPEQLARSAQPLSSGPSIPSGPAPSLDDAIGETDLVVRGTVGVSSSYLSPDAMDVYTDYVLVAPAVIYGPDHTDSKKVHPARTIAVTILGGQIMINGLTYTSRHEALPELPQGADCLFLLKRVGDKNMLARTYYGAFDLTTGKTIALARKRGFAEELRREDAALSIERISTRVAAMRAPRR
jgi:hypothetical protein